MTALGRVLKEVQSGLLRARGLCTTRIPSSGRVYAQWDPTLTGQAVSPWHLWVPGHVSTQNREPETCFWDPGPGVEVVCQADAEWEDSRFRWARLSQGAAAVPGRATWPTWLMSRLQLLARLLQVCRFCSNWAPACCSRWFMAT